MVIRYPILWLNRGDFVLFSYFLFNFGNFIKISIPNLFLSPTITIEMRQSNFVSMWTNMLQGEHFSFFFYDEPILYFETTR